MPHAIVFDLDGTLVDSAPDIAAAANRMLADFDLPPLPEAQLRGFIGHGIPNLVRQVIAFCGLDPSIFARMNDRMLAHYTARPAELTRPFPNVQVMLEALVADGHRLGICTNKYHALSVQVLDALDLSRFFGIVVGGDTLTVKKPDPAPLHMAFDRLGGARLLYVGDSEVDAETGVAAGIGFALFTKGYRKAAVETLPHRFAFDDHAALPPVIAELA